MDGMLKGFIILSIVIAVLAFGFALWLYFWVKRQPTTNTKIQDIGELIRKGANTFLSKEYVILARFALVVAGLILIFLDQKSVV